MLEVFAVLVSEGARGGLTEGGSALLYFPLLNVSSLASTCRVQAEAVFARCPLFATARMMPLVPTQNR